MVMVAVMHGKLLHSGVRELPRTAPAHPWIHLQGSFAIPSFAGLGGTAGISDDLVESGCIRFFTLHHEEHSITKR